MILKHEIRTSGPVVLGKNIQSWYLNVLCYFIDIVLCIMCHIIHIVSKSIVLLLTVRRQNGAFFKILKTPFTKRDLHSRIDNIKSFISHEN